MEQQPFVENVADDWTTTTSYDDAATWLRDNQYIRHFHRQQLSLRRAICTLIYPWHNQLLNIWTHLLSAILYVYLEFSATTDLEKSYELRAYRLAAALCFLVSATFHLLMCISETVKIRLNKADYFAILSFLAVAGGCAIRAIFDGHKFWMTIFGFCGMFMYGSVMSSLFDVNFQSNDDISRRKRAKTFFAFGLSIIVPFGVGWFFDFQHGLGDWIPSILLVVVAGLLCFAYAFPESQCPDPGWVYLKQKFEDALKDQTKPYDSKKNVWVPDPDEGYIAAEIKSAKGDQVVVVTAKGNEQTLKKDQVQEMNPPKYEKSEDMANLTFLNDASVLNNLRQRYYVMMIYTYSGLFCVVINPYKRLPIYTESVIKLFIGKRRNEVPPHLFAASDEAYRYMMQDHEHQSMLITGESGAGKTENTKKVIAYFAIVGATQAAAAKKAAKTEEVAQTGPKQATLEEQIVQTNPVLEAFGNAKTVRNNNSSRFGKFIRIHFDPRGKLAGGDIEHYLLEKSRVVFQAPGHRCYHIFYQIMSGQIPGLKEKLQLSNNVKDYHFVSQGDLIVDGMDDKEEMKLTDEAFDIMAFAPEEKFNMFKLCAAIMHMGEMKFKQRPREEQAEVDTDDDAKRASANFGVNHEDFLKALLKPRVRVGNEWVNKGQNLQQVDWAVSALSKAIYARMFHWLIKRCNKTLDASVLERKHFIGVLDIAGFEIFDFNSFEQQWINFVNEKLQQFFNHHMFVLEQEEYQKEGIKWEFIDFGLDLQACIELIEKPLGIISMLDEQCIVPKATDMTYVQGLMDQHLGKHPNFQKPKPPKGKQAEAHFAIVHYAGTVRYNANNWLEKNKDPLNDSVVQVFKNSGEENQLLHDIWEDYQTQEEVAAAAAAGTQAVRKGKSGSFQTVSMVYRESLNKLMHMLHQTHPHFIRCIIPNEEKKSGMLDAALCLNQLTCNGVLEGIRICRKGFPNRVMYPDFKQRYAILAAAESRSSDDPKVGSTKMLDKLAADKKLSDEEFRVGTTKVFFKAGILARMEDLRDEALSLILTGFQAQVRHWTARCEAKRREEQRAGFLILSRNIRQWITLRTWPWFKLYGKVKPMLKSAKADEEITSLEEKIKSLETSLAREEAQRKDYEEQIGKLVAEKNQLFLDLQNEKTKLSAAEEQVSKLTTQKNDLDKQVSELNDRLTTQEEKNADLSKAKKKIEQDVENLNRKIQDLELALKKSETEKQSKDNQIRSLQDEMTHQDDLVGKLNKEKKQQEEVNKKLLEDLQGAEDEVNHLNKIRTKLEQQLDDVENGLEREKRGRQDGDKGTRKIQGDLKVAHENIEELKKQKHDLETNLKKKEQELHHISSKLEDEQSLVGKLQKQIKELQTRIQELEEELEGERNARSKAEKARADLQHQLEELSERLDEAGGATAAQIELNKKRETELAKLRRDLEAQNLNHESALSALRKKHNDAVAEMGEQLDQMQKIKAKLEKEKAQLARDLEEANAVADAEAKAKAESDRLAKSLELQVAELQAKSDEQTRQLSDLTALKARLGVENADLLHQLEESESQTGLLTRLKGQLQGQLEDTKRQLDEETRERHTLAAQVKNYEAEVESIKDQMEDEAAAKSDVQRQLSKANAEIQQWKARFESEGLAKVEEIEAAKKQLLSKIGELQETLEQGNIKIGTLEKAKHKLMGELDDAQVDVERANAYAQQLEKKQKVFDQIIDEWNQKYNDLAAELDASQRENRNLSTECFKLKTAQDELAEQVESLRRENKNLAIEIKDLTDQLTEGGRSVHELQKIVRRLESEKEELQQALDEAESALEAEEAKVLRAQVEVSQIRQDIERRLREKEEEFENTRKNHQRALESMQTTLEAEAKGRQEALRLKKKLESDINELEIALDHANKANADAQKNIKLYQEQVKELQLQIEEEQRERDLLREAFENSEKRGAVLQAERDEFALAAEQAERARRQAETEVIDLREQNNDLANQANALNATKRKLEAELQALHAELDDSLNELKKLDEQAKKAMADAARLAEELRQEQEHSMHIERMRKGLEVQVKELQIRLDEAEQAALKGGKKIIQALEQKIRQLEVDLDAENRRYQEADKNLRKQDRRINELQFQIEEDRKSAEQLQELVDQLQMKLKVYKRQIDEAEELAATNLAKYRQAQQQVDDSNERADVAENSLAKIRAKVRSTPSVGPILMPSASAIFARSPSRTRQGPAEF